MACLCAYSVLNMRSLCAHCAHFAVRTVHHLAESGWLISVRPASKGAQAFRVQQCGEQRKRFARCAHFAHISPLNLAAHLGAHSALHSARRLCAACALPGRQMCASCALVVRQLRAVQQVAPKAHNEPQSRKSAGERLALAAEFRHLAGSEGAPRSCGPCLTRGRHSKRLTVSAGALLGLPRPPSQRHCAGSKRRPG